MHPLLASPVNLLFLCLLSPRASQAEDCQDVLAQLTPRSYSPSRYLPGAPLSAPNPSRQALRTSQDQTSPGQQASTPEPESPPTGPAIPASSLEARPRLLMVDLSVIDPDLLPAAARFSQALRQGLASTHQVLDLEALEPVHGVPPAAYWAQCPEKATCLALLGERAQAQVAITGQLSLKAVPPVDGQPVPSMDTYVIHFQLQDVVRDDPLPPLQVELVGDDPVALVEAVALALELAEQPPSPATTPSHPIAPPTGDDPLRTPPASDPDPLRAPGPEDDDLPEMDRDVPKPPPVTRLPPTLHGGQLVARANAGFQLGATGLYYLDWQLLAEGQGASSVVDELAFLGPLSGVSPHLQLGVGLSLGKRVELEANWGRARVPYTFQVYQEQAAVYALDPFPAESCLSGTGEGCPERRSATASAWTVGLQGRLFVGSSLTRRPYLLLGASLVLPPQPTAVAQEMGISTDGWWQPDQAYRPLHLSLGPGIQLEVGRRWGLFIQLPLRYSLGVDGELRQASSLESPVFASLPDGRQRLRFGGGLELGLAGRLF